MRFAPLLLAASLLAVAPSAHAATKSRVSAAEPTPARIVIEDPVAALKAAARGKVAPPTEPKETPKCEARKDARPLDEAFPELMAVRKRASVIGRGDADVSAVAAKVASAFQDAADGGPTASRNGNAASEIERLAILAALEAERLRLEQFINVIDDAVIEGVMTPDLGESVVDELLQTLADLQELIDFVFEHGAVGGGDFGGSGSWDPMETLGDAINPFNALRAITIGSWQELARVVEMSNEQAAWDLEERTGMDINGDGCKGNTEYGRCKPFDKDDAENRRRGRQSRGDGIIVVGIPNDGCAYYGLCEDLILQPPVEVLIDFDPIDSGELIGGVIDLAPRIDWLDTVIDAAQPIQGFPMPIR